jgi:hypothetical protein
MTKVDLIQSIVDVNDWDFIQAASFDVTNGDWVQLPLRVYDELNDEDAISAFEEIEKYLLSYQENGNKKFGKCFGNVIDSQLIFVRWL